MPDPIHDYSYQSEAAFRVKPEDDVFKLQKSRAKIIKSTIISTVIFPIAVYKGAKKLAGKLVGKVILLSQSDKKSSVDEIRTKATTDPEYT